MLKEATILRFRHDQDPGFAASVHPGRGRAELKNNRLWDPVDLPELQFLPATMPPDRRRDQDDAGSLGARIG